jgi:hypothetical protein
MVRRRILESPPALPIVGVDAESGCPLGAVKHSILIAHLWRAVICYGCRPPRDRAVSAHTRACDLAGLREPSTRTYARA